MKLGGGGQILGFGVRTPPGGSDPPSGGGFLEIGQKPQIWPPPLGGVKKGVFWEAMSTMAIQFHSLTQV